MYLVSLTEFAAAERQINTQQSPDCWVIGESEKYKLMYSML